VAAGWLRVRFDADPTAAATGDVVGVAIEAAAVVAVDLAEGSRLSVTGDLFVESVSGDGRWVTGTLRGSSTTRDVGGADQTRSVQLPTTIEPVPAQPGTRVLRITVQLPTERGTALVVELAMAGDLATITGNVSLAFVKGSRTDRRAVDVGAGTTSAFPIVEASLAADPAVLDPAAAENALARSAVAILGEAFDDPSFAPTALARLFPGQVTAPPAVERVRPVTDWVLFHRRRDRRCAGALPPQPARPDRRFDVYAADVAGPDEADLLRAALYRDDEATLKRLGLRRVDAVTFAGGTATLTSSEAALATSWAAAQPGPVVTYGAIGTRDGGDGPAVEGDRLARLVDRLGSVAPTGAVPTDLLGAVPAALDRPGIDGAVVVGTGRPVVTTCIDVREPIGLGGMPRLLRQGTIAEVLAASTRLGRVRFEGLHADPGDLDAVRNAWVDKHGLVDALISALHRSGDPDAGTPEERAARVAAVAGVFPGIKPPGDLAVQADLGSDCPVVMLVFQQPGDPLPRDRSTGTRIVGGSIRHWSMSEPRDAERVQVAGMPLRDLDEARLDELERDGVIQALGVVTWAAGSPDLGVSTVRTIADAGLDPGTLSRVVVVVPEGYEDVGLAEERAKGVVARAGGQLSGQDVVVVEVPGEVPGGAMDTVTFLLFDRG
jgi:hypothetical protein